MSAFRFLLMVALTVAAIGLNGIAAEAITRPETLYHEKPVTTGVVEPGFPVDHVGVVFGLAPGADHDHDHEGGLHAGTEGVAVRFRHGGVWGPWQQMIEDGAQALGMWTGALVSGDDAEAYQVRGVPSFARNARVAALNTTDGPEVVVGHRPTSTADAVTTCKSRADWGADESIRTSTRSYAPVQIMTVHHTATQNDDPTPDSRVRAIYEYHVKTNNWDDIGYQALISEDGTVYEGRWSGSDSTSCAAGGTGWDFGHYGTAADAEMVTGAHTGGYNTGNYGVALLGTLTSVAPKAAARDALVEYLAELTDRHGIDPQAQIAYDNGTNAKTVNAISGHRDFTATECPGGTLYADLPTIRSDVASALSSSAPPVVTITSPADTDTYAAQESDAGAGVTLTLTADATDESTALGWSWTDANGNEVASTSSFSKTLAAGFHSFTATATDAEGLSGSDTISVTVEAAGTPATYVDAAASDEQTHAGTVAGSYLDTQADGGGTERITEVESAGGPPSDRHSLLEHVWATSVTSGSSVTLFVDAVASASGDGDDFQFAYSSDGGQSYTKLLTIPAGGSGTYSAELPATTSGTVHIRVKDVNRNRGARALDSITVDHLFIRSESGTTPTPAPAAPGSLTATAPSATSVDLVWTDVDGEWGYELERSDDGGKTWSRIGEFGADVTSHQDTGLTASTTYSYQVRAYNGGGPSAWTGTSVTTDAVSGIALQASGRKVKGQHHVELTWSGATNVDVYRNGSLVATLSGTAFTDVTGSSGKGSYVHKVCTTDGTCSNEVTTTFS